jgi:hypothetical protein
MEPDMVDLKLPRLPDRSPVKLTITLTSDQNQALKDYASLYERTYGTAEAVHDLVPFIIEAFLASDRAFVRESRR